MYEDERSLHGGNGLAAGVGGTARTARRMTNGQREGFVGGQAEELRRMALALTERLTEVGREAAVLEEQIARDDGRIESLMAAQDALAELHELDPAAFEQAATFIEILRRVAKETVRPSSAVCGERNGASKLTEAAVLSIRRRHREGESMETLAREYGVYRGTIKDVVKHRTWRKTGRDDRERRETR